MHSARFAASPGIAGLPLRARALALALSVGLASGPALAGPAPPKAAGAGASPVQIKRTPVPGHDMPRLDAELTIEAPIEKVWALIIDCNRLGEFMDVEKTRLLWRRGNVSRCLVVVDVPFPFGTLSSVNDSTEERSATLFRLSFKLVSGDFHYDEGTWELSPTPQGYTRVRYSALVEPKLPVPRGLLESGQRDFIEKMMLKLRERLTAQR